MKSGSTHNPHGQNKDTGIAKRSQLLHHSQYTPEENLFSLSMSVVLGIPRNKQIKSINSSLGTNNMDRNQSLGFIETLHSTALYFIGLHTKAGTINRIID